MDLKLENRYPPSSLVVCNHKRKLRIVSVGMYGTAQCTVYAMQNH